MSLLAIDIGSSTCKAVAFSAEGEILARHTTSFSPDFPEPSHAEMNPESFWDAVRICSCGAARGLTDAVQALCINSHGETFVPVNARSEVLAPAILNQDNRAFEETTWLEEQLGRKRLFEITGLTAHPMYPVPKILWLRKHQPERFPHGTRFVSVIGYILLRLGLEPYIDYSLASRYLAFDVREHRWSGEVLGAAGLDSGSLPIPVPAGTVAGKLGIAAAGQLGLPVGIPIVVGGHDQPCGALGLGVVGPGHVSDSIGTYECLLAASDSPVLTDAALAASLNSYCHVVPEKFVTVAYFPSGIMVKWFHDLVHDCAEDSRGQGSEAEHYASLEANAPAGPTGLCITPNLIGTCNPDFNPHARGVIFGLNAGTRRAHIYKGILEGLACEFSEMTTLLSTGVEKFKDIYVAGGGAGSALGLRLRAAIAGQRLHVMRCSEAVCMGGAILAGVAVGEYSSIREAVDQVVDEVAVIEPDPSIGLEYIQQVARYQRLRSALAPLQKA